MASRPLKRPLVGYFLGPVDPSHVVDFDAMGPAGGWTPFTAVHKRASARFTATVLFPSEQAAKPTLAGGADRVETLPSPG